MDDNEYEKLSTIANQLTSMTFVLKSCCENYEQSIPEFAQLYEFTVMLHDTSNRICELL